MIISLISQKGGVGKSTVARLLAVEMARAGWSTFIADLDAAQGTSTRWHMRRQQLGLEPEVDVMRIRTVKRALEEARRYDLALIDGPAHAERGGRDMAKHSDLVILPTGYSLDDLEPQIQVAYELEAAGVPTDRIRLAICRARGSESERRAVLAYIRKSRIPAFTAELRELPTIRQAHTSGACAAETNHPRVNAEAAALVSEIAATLNPEA